MVKKAMLPDYIVLTICLFTVEWLVVFIGLLFLWSGDKKIIQKRKLACKHDWGNTNFCKICLSINDCPVT